MKTKLKRRLFAALTTDLLNYTKSKNYLPEEDIHWNNIYDNLYDMPQEFIDELTNSLQNYSRDSFEFNGEHPETVCANWVNNPSLKEKLNAQQLTNINMIFVPEIRQITTLY